MRGPSPFNRLQAAFFYNEVRSSNFSWQRADTRGLLKQELKTGVI